MKADKKIRGDIGNMWVDDRIKVSVAFRGYTGRVEFKDDGENILVDGDIKDGALVGVWRLYYSNEKVTKEYVFSELTKWHDRLKMSGIAREWYANGKVALKGEYVADDRQNKMGGKWRVWNDKGNIIYNKIYESPGKLCFGRFQYLTYEGKEFNNFRNDSNGYKRYEELLPQGKRGIHEGYYKKKQRQGWWKYYINDGRLVNLIYYKDSIPYGLGIIVEPWLLRFISPEFREFGKQYKGAYPCVVYFNSRGDT